VNPYFTALITIATGVLIYVLGQMVIRLVIEPGLELKRLIARIGRDLDFYANKLFQTEYEDQVRSTFRGHAGELPEKIHVIVFYRLVAVCCRLPPFRAVMNAADLLRYYSNYPIPADPRWWRDPTSDIKRLLRITR